MDMAGIHLVIGILLLVLGRRLFWLFVGAAGFLTGVNIADRFFAGSEPMKLLIALVIGIIFAFLAILFYKAAVAVAGFVIGGYLAVDLVGYFSVSQPHSLDWMPYMIGGIIGAVLILLLLDWALIVLSSLAGASLIVHSISLPRVDWSLVYIVLAMIGILIQAGILTRSRSAAI